MEVRLLKKSVIRTEEFYKDFLEGNIELKDEYFDGDKVVYIDEAPDFPIYMAIKNEEEKNKLFKEAFDIISKYYIKTDRDIHLDEMFWYSLFCTKKREYLLEKYQPKEVIICCFIDKKCARKIDVDVDYVGYTIDKPAFLMGYGLDYNEFARNIDYVYIPPKEEIELYDKLSK